VDIAVVELNQLGWSVMSFAVFGRRHIGYLEQELKEEGGV